MEKVIYDEKNGLWYELQSDYYIPCLKLPEKERQPIGVWGQRRLRYIKQNRKVLYLNHCAYYDEQSGSRSHLFHSIFTEDCKGNAGSENYCADQEQKPSETHKGKGQTQCKAGRKTGD